MFKDVFKNFKSHCMTGISYMIPVIVIGGFCTAIARLCGNVDVQGTLGYAFISAGNAAFGLMMSVLCAGVAYSICGKPGIAPGVVAGYLSTQVKASFLGALICGFLIALAVMWSCYSLFLRECTKKRDNGIYRNRKWNYLNTWVP